MLYLHFSAELTLVTYSYNFVVPEVAVPAEEKRLATWGTDIPDDLVLDQGKLAEALKKVYAYFFVTR